MNIIEFEYEGSTYECDSDVLSSYTFIYGIRMAQEKLKEGDMIPWFRAMDKLFPEGRHLDYVTALDEDMEKLGHLVSAAIAAGAPKN